MIANRGTSAKTFLFIILLVVMGCTGSITAGENRLLYEDHAARQMLVYALKTRNITYRVDSEGGVWYPAKDVKIIDGIAKEIVEARFSGPAASFEDPTDVVSFRKKLAAVGIPYKTKLQHGQEWTTWEKVNDVRVKEIQEEVENENIERAKAERAKPPKG